MLKETVVKMFEQNNIAAFEVSNGLDPKTDIILSDCSIENFIKFCNSASKNLVFYQALEFDIDDYLVDEEEFKTDIISIIQDRLDEDKEVYESLTVEDFETEINNKIKEIHIHNIESKNKLSKMKQPEIQYASVYTFYDNKRVGIMFDDDFMEDYPMAYEIRESLTRNISSLIEDKLIECEEEWDLKEEQKKEKRREEILEDVCTYISNNINATNCKNRILRHGFSKQIAEKYKRKYDINIPINVIEALVEEEFQNLK